VEKLLQALSLEEKIRLLSGEDFWSTYAMPKIGLRKMVLSDGPAGVRGEVWDERFPSLSLPSASALAASWDIENLNLVGRISASEAIRKGVDVILGPTINLHRSPLAGRHFECFSEDPYLTGKLAAGFIQGAQLMGIGACPKHYVANETENDRYTYDAIIDEQTLHELYLQAFELAILEADPWMLMSSYNSTNGHSMSESPLLEDPLRKQWKFSGVVVSDWTAVRSVIQSANSGQDLAMPGPTTPWSQGLLDAVTRGDVNESVINEKVRRLLKLAKRVGALEHNGRIKAETSVSPKDNHRSDLKRLAIDGMVMVRNNGVLPINFKSGQIAVIGSHAQVGRIMGGGSATVLPFKPVSPLEGIRNSFGDKLSVAYAPGVYVNDNLVEPPIEQCYLADGSNGVLVKYFNSQGEVILEEVRYSGRFIKLDGGPNEPVHHAEAITRFKALESGTYRIGGGGTGSFTLGIDEVQVELNDTIFDPEDLLGALLSPPQTFTEILLEADQEIDIVLRYEPIFTPIWDAFSLSFGIRFPRELTDIEMKDAIDLARESEVAIVVVGTTEQVESEGYDRESLALPGQQNELVAQIISANPRTIVVVNSGGPVELPWLDDAAAVILSWFPGEEFGNALGDILIGSSEPGGRMPTTWPVKLQDAVVSSTDPISGKIHYSEGLDIGYRGFAKRQIEPMFWFGSGMGYTTWKLESVEVDSVHDCTADLVVSVEITNTGTRHGSHIVQAYLSRENSSFIRPTRWLGGFIKVEAAAGQTSTVQIRIEKKRFQLWHEGWELESGIFTIHVAHDSSLRNAISRELEIVDAL
jgi:beta-glucosidase